ncbi:exonuclease VII large subunit [Spirosoma lacussanchae]|uniref:competence protein CoiA family protein n=1 Tax=Spirosoma lacussanchae TaxID=1884249 RepID=UPI003D24B70C
MTDADESQSIYTANTADGTTIFIGQAQSGKNGYFCQSCGYELVAKIGRYNIAHFAHAVRDAEQKAQCTYADESYRHQLAKAILQRIGQVKVPDVLVYPPDRNLRDAIRIKAAEVIKAHSVEVELTLRLTPDGILRVGRFNDIELETSGDFYIKPDVTFLDANRYPILLIELVATNRPDAEKLARLNLIGINTIQIDLPRNSAEAIEHSFYTIEFTKWLYNHEQAKAIYSELPQTAGGRVPEFDKIQDQLTREDIRCRTNRIRNLIRGIKRYLDSEPNLQATEAINAAIERVVSEGVIVDQRLRERTGRIKQSIRERFKDQVAACNQAETTVEAEETELGIEEADIETKYSQETGRIDRDQDDIRKRSDPRIGKAEEEIGDVERAIDECQRRSREDEKTLRDTYQRTVEDDRRAVDEYAAKLATARTEYEGAVSARNRTERAVRDAAAKEQRLRKRIAELRKRIEEVTKPRIASIGTEIDQLERTAANSAESFEQQTQRDIERFERAAEQAVHNGDTTQLPTELRVFKELFAGWQAVGDYQRQARAYQRLREIIREIESATWKSWYKPR